MGLSGRKKKILAAVVEEYIRTAEPVGSKTIAQTANLGCSSATIRNELAELTGMGYLKGIQTQSEYPTSLPARETDEIFAVCGEEFGLIGCLLLLALLAAIILRCIWVSRRACSPKSAFIAMGYAGMLLAQVAVNVGMCLYVFPVVGLTLPFISYGGTSVVTMYAAMGLVSSIKMRSLSSWLRDRSQL